MKYTQEIVEKIFKDNNCELLSEYINYNIKLKYLCKCGNISEILLNNFNKGKRCRKCGNNNIPTQQDVEQYFKEKDCELLDIYKNSKTKLKYKCRCKNISYISMDSFKAGNRCMKCGKKEKLSQKYVKQYFSDNGCELLDVYVNNHKKLKYICNCGNQSEICFYSFQQGNRCMKCGILKRKRTGSDHHLWNSNRNEKRKIKELQSLSKSYRNNFRKKYNVSKEYDIDHIFPIKAFVNYGIYDLNLINLEENLQPLLSYENRNIKKDKYDNKQFEIYLKNKGLIK